MIPFRLESCLLQGMPSSRICPRSPSSWTADRRGWCWPPSFHDEPCSPGAGLLFHVDHLTWCVAESDSRISDHIRREKNSSEADIFLLRNYFEIKFHRSQRIWSTWLAPTQNLNKHDDVVQSSGDENFNRQNRKKYIFCKFKSLFNASRYHL